MQEVFEKIEERVCEFVHERNGNGEALCKNQSASCLQLIRICDLTRIVNEVAEEFENSEQVTPSNGWIPCSERLPEGKETHKILVTDEDGIMAVCYFLEVTKVFKVCWDGWNHFNLFSF